MKIVMLGAGALGSTIGGTLAIGGNDVHFVDMWQEHVDLINKDGLHMTNEKEDWYVRVDARTTADTIGEADLVIVLVKSFATKLSAHQKSEAEDTRFELTPRRVCTYPRPVVVYSSCLLSTVSPSIVRHGGFA